jgi:hypothetical protein
MGAFPQSGSLTQYVTVATAGGNFLAVNNDGSVCIAGTQQRAFTQGATNYSLYTWASTAPEMTSDSVGSVTTAAAASDKKVEPKERRSLSKEEIAEIEKLKGTITISEGLRRELKTRGLNDIQLKTRMKLFLFLKGLDLLVDDVACSMAVLKFDNMSHPFQNSVADCKTLDEFKAKGEQFIVNGLVSGSVSGLKVSALREKYEKVFSCCGQAGAITGDKYTCPVCKQVKALVPVTSQKPSK